MLSEATVQAGDDSTWMQMRNFVASLADYKQVQLAFMGHPNGHEIITQLMSIRRSLRLIDISSAVGSSRYN
jgi:hypothetical protein